jgi:hypothetical protein
MSVFPGGEGPLMGDGPETEDPQLDLYAHVEHLSRQEAQLLKIGEHERTAHQHERLKAISAELDRIAEHLAERARRLGRATT